MSVFALPDMRELAVVLVLLVFAGFCGCVGATIARYTKPHRPVVSGFIATLLGISSSYAFHQRSR